MVVYGSVILIQTKYFMRMISTLKYKWSQKELEVKKKGSSKWSSNLPERIEYLTMFRVYFQGLCTSVMSIFTSVPLPPGWLAHKFLFHYTNLQLIMLLKVYILEMYLGLNFWKSIPFSVVTRITCPLCWSSSTSLMKPSTT